MMDLASVRDHCLAKPGAVTEDFPFDEEVLVFKLFGKIFLLTNVNGVPFTMNLKCDPERAIELRERYPAIEPGYHMNKKRWNTVTVDGSLSDAKVRELIDHSYDEVAKRLPKKIREKLEKGSGDGRNKAKVKSKK